MASNTTSKTASHSASKIQHHSRSDLQSHSSSHSRSNVQSHSSSHSRSEFRTKTVVISGYYGFGNSGDEAVLHAILKALREEGEKQQLSIEPIVLSIDPKATERIHRVKAVHRLNLFSIIRSIRQSDLLISGGGSLLQDTTGLSTIPYYLGIIKLAQWLGKPTFIYSQGLGPIRHKAYYPLIRHTFNRSEYISVRDAESINLIEHIGVRPKRNIAIVSDPVMGLPLEEYAMDGTSEVSEANEALGASNVGGAGGVDGVSGAERVPVIGISVRLWHPQRKDLDAMTASLRIILEQRKVHLRFLPFYPPDDVEACEHIIRQLGEQYTEQISMASEANQSDFGGMLRHVSSCDLIIGMRLHSLIYAASYLIPMIGVSYDPKIDHFLQRIEMTSSGSTDHFDAEAVAEEALYMLDHREEWVSSKQHLIDAMKNKTSEPAKQICEFLRLMP